MLMFFQNRAVSGACTLSYSEPVAHCSCGSLDENGLVARQSRKTLPLPDGWPVMNECRPLSDWQRCTSASWPRSANVNLRAPSRREIGSRDTQSCTVIHFDPRCVPTMLLTKCSAVAFRTQPFLMLSKTMKFR